MDNSVHFILQGKGGVGKSFIASILAQYFLNRSRLVKSYDTDPINQTLTSYTALNAKHIPLLDGSKINERNFDFLIEKIITEDGIFIVDNGASSFVPLSNYLIENNVFSLLEESGKKVYIHCVITGGQALLDTLSGFNALSKQTGVNNIVVWLNEFFGAVESDGKFFTDMKAYKDNAQNIYGIIQINKRNQDTFGKDIELMISQKKTFEEAIKGEGFSLMARQRIKTVQKDIFGQIDKIGL